MAFHEAQDDLKTAKEQVVSSDEYISQRTAILKEESHAAKLAKFEHDSLMDDPAYQRAHDKQKAAKLVYDRVRSELFKANADWVAATSASKEASEEENKASSEATRGAMKKMPAMRNLREAKAVADDARASIAEAEMVLRSLNATPRDTGGTPYGSSATTTESQVEKRGFARGCGLSQYGCWLAMSLSGWGWPIVCTERA